MEYGAQPTRFKGERRDFEIDWTHPELVYESGKCIDCGLCVQIAAEAREAYGLSFIGRGFSVRVAAPFDENLVAGLREVGLACVDACPTGALSRKEGE
jgi:NADH dehydrogenase/NADH:ubiquinone oxidoreductase subunit G